MMVAHHPVALFSHSDACIKELDKFFMVNNLASFASYQVASDEAAVHRWTAMTGWEGFM
jgi:hypothetical protein